ncbi:MAG: DGQHR domain-containing protein [Bradymonadia bacterium]
MREPEINWRQAVSSLGLLAKVNMDGSFSASFEAGALVKHGFVDFYEEDGGSGYQRKETSRNRRGREIAKYIGRCLKEQVKPHLFELTANARNQPDQHFEPIDEKKRLGFLNLLGSGKWLSIIDGGTRMLGIEMALAEGYISPSDTFDVRVYVNQAPAQEIAHFLLINDKQKRVRTDLSLRVVQNAMDDDQLSDDDKRILQTVVPDTDSWRFEASRLVGMLNSNLDSPWHGLIQMPNEAVTKPIKHGAFFSSLRPILCNEDLSALIEAKFGDSGSSTEFFYRVLVRFWGAVKSVNKQAWNEPRTNVLWQAIGVSSCHIALSPILVSILNADRVLLGQDNFESMIRDSTVSDYAYWYSKPGKKQPLESYPGQKGDAPKLTGAANYVRLGRELEKLWRSALHAKPAEQTITW